MGETHFVLRDTWKQRFLQQHAAEGGPLTVAKLRRWTDLPDARGLSEEVQNLLVLTFRMADRTELLSAWRAIRRDGRIDSR